VHGRTVSPSWSPTATAAQPGRSWSLAGSGHRQRGIPDEEDIMLLEHAHQPGRFDPGHCRDRARETDLLDHYWRVQREEQAFKEARRDLAGSGG
jgi:hypothetical protein